MITWDGNVNRNCSPCTQEIFEAFGPLERCELKSGRRADYAFLNFLEEKDAEDAIRELQGKEVHGSRYVTTRNVFMQCG